MSERLLFLKLSRTVCDPNGKILGNSIIIAGPPEKFGEFAFFRGDNIQVVTD